ncbi:MAG: hypothetical protein ACJAVV_002809 [Alphaproteobacteria bacterium]
MLERIDVERNSSGTINTINFNKTAALIVGKGLNPEFEATVFKGLNAHNRKMIGGLTGAYTQQGFSDLTPNGVCKENGCAEGPYAAAGASGRLVGVLRISNTLDNAPVSTPGGHDYIGAERSDVHAAIVVEKARLKFK